MLDYLPHFFSFLLGFALLLQSAPKEDKTGILGRLRWTNIAAIIILFALPFTIINTCNQKSDDTTFKDTTNQTKSNTVSIIGKTDSLGAAAICPPFSSCHKVVHHDFPPI